MGNMKVLEVKEEDIDCCHDTLKQSLVQKFIDGNYTYISTRDFMGEDTVYNTEVVRTHGEYIVTIADEIIID